MKTTIANTRVQPESSPRLDYDRIEGRLTEQDTGRPTTATRILQSIARLIWNRSGILLIVLLAILWQYSVQWHVVNTPTFPDLSRVLHAFFKLLGNGTLVSAFGQSLERLFIGFGISCVLGVLIGAAMGYFSAVNRLLDPLVEMLRPIPSPAYIPMAILFFGIGSEMKIVIVVFSCIFPILLNTFAGVRNVDQVALDTGRSLGLNNLQIIRKILIPASSPYIMTGMRISVSVALIVTVIAEMVAGNSGIGYLLIEQQQTFQIPQMYASVIGLAVVGFTLNKSFSFIEHRAMRWNRVSGR